MKIKKKKYKDLEIFFSNYKVDYLNSIKYLEERVNKVFRNEEKELIWFLEHPSIYTSGRSFLVKDSSINKIPVFNTARGGKITWHGPGQRIMYVVMSLKKRQNDIRNFVYALESFIISSLEELNIKCFRKKNAIGIWTKNKLNVEAKIASLGLRVSRGIIYHGVSINLNCNLKNFYNISPCGIANAEVTSAKEIKNRNISFSEFDEILESKLDIFY